MVARYSDPTDQLFVFFPEPKERVGIQTLKTYCERMQADNIHRAIIVVAQGMTPSAKAVMEEMAPKYIIQMFNEQELLINITEHELVPNHQVLTDDEKIELLKRYKIEEKLLPRIQINDPISRYFGTERSPLKLLIF